jgi:hypothetical protein
MAMANPKAVLRKTIFAGFSIAAAWTASSVTSRADILWGVNGHPFTAYPGISFEQQLNYVKDLGMKSYRVNIPDIRFASDLARLVAEAKTRDVEILPIITPDVDLDRMSAKDLYARSYDLAFALVSQFKNDIRVWELGNELENYAIIKACEMQDDGVQYNCSWGPAGGTGVLHYFSPRWEKVRSVLRGLSDGVMAVDPSLRKAVGTAGWGHTGAFLRMMQDGIQWDITVWHHYEGDPEEALKFLVRLNRPIWITEFNNPRGSEKGEQQQADGLVEMMTYLRRYQVIYNVEAAHLYELMDEPYWSPSFEAVMGLVGMVQDSQGKWMPGKPKPAYDAVKQFIAAGSAQTSADAPTGTITSTSGVSLGRPALSRTELISRRCSLASFDSSVSSAENQAAYCVCLVMGRMPTPDEQWSLVSALKQGMTIPRMLSDVLASDEVRDRFLPSKMSNREFVIMLYRLLLRREPDNVGLTSYVSQLERGALSRVNLQHEIISSNEFQSRNAILFPDQKK